MCNLYKVTSSIEAMRQLVRSFNLPNLPVLGDIYPNYAAPIFRTAPEGIELTMLEWGVPLPSRDGRKPKPVTNVRNLASPFWRSMLADPGRRCLVPAAAFSEWTADPDPATGRKACVWFDLPDRELFCIAGIWRPSELGPRFALLTTEANDLVSPIHPAAMPVILHREDHERWLTDDFAGACGLQRPYPADRMRIRADLKAENASR